MSDFFDSPLVQEVMDEINKLQEQIYSEVFEFADLDKEKKLHHLEKLDHLLEKQRNLYTRLSLSDDPRAVAHAADCWWQVPLLLQRACPDMTVAR